MLFIRAQKTLHQPVIVTLRQLENIVWICYQETFFVHCKKRINHTVLKTISRKSPLFPAGMNASERDIKELQYWRYLKIL